MKKVNNAFGRAFHHVSERLRGAKTFYRRVKSLLILAFVALAIFLTGQLWFVNLSNRNFFLYLSARFQPAVAEGYREFVRPMRSVYGDGTGRFNKSYSGLMDAAPRDYFDMVLTELFENGTYIGVSAKDYNRLLSRPILMFQYAFLMPGHVFPLGFDQRTGAFLTTRGINEFSSVAIWLPYNNEGVSVFFIGENRMWEFTLDSDRLEGFPVLPVSTSTMYFVSAALEGYDNVPPGTFIPRSGDHGRFTFSPITVTNPYVPRAGPTLTFIHNMITPFFDNPATINGRIAGDGVWTYSNIHTVVRYFDTDVLEYASFLPRRQSVTTGLMGDFSAALAFIRDDNHVINEFFLKGFEPRGEGYMFRFGYIIDNYPILLLDGWPVSSADDLLSAPIEVTVEQGQVVFYRRLAHNFYVAGEHDWLWARDLDLNDILSDVAEPVLGISLGYRMTLAEISRNELLSLELHVIRSEEN